MAHRMTISTGSPETMKIFHRLMESTAAEIFLCFGNQVKRWLDISYWLFEAIRHKFYCKSMK